MALTLIPLDTKSGVKSSELILIAPSRIDRLFTSYHLQRIKVM